jgi:hypothetical protein
MKSESERLSKIMQYVPAFNGSVKETAKHLAALHEQETEDRWRKHPELRWAIEQYREALRNEELHGSETAYYRGVMWALRNMYSMANNGMSLEIDASPDRMPRVDDDAERRLTDGMNQSLEWDALHGG